MNDQQKSKEALLKTQNIIKLIEGYDWRELEAEKYEDTEFQSLIDDSKNSKQVRQSGSKIPNRR